MLRGYRCIILALGLVLIAASPTGQQSAGQNQKPQGEVTQSLERIAEALDKANEPERGTADCPKGSEDRKSDLCAQWKAADAAQQAASAADRTVTVGLIGLVLGAVTMGAAIAAAWYAKSAAENTKSGNAIAIEQMRGRIEIIGVNACRDGEHLRYFVLARNLGASPAVINGVCRESRPHLAPHPLWMDKLAPEVVEKPIILLYDPNGGIGVTIAKDISPFGPLVIGYVEYDTVTLRNCRTYFSATSKVYGPNGIPTFEQIKTIGQPKDT